MKTWLDCVPCLVQQGLKVARMASPDPAVHEAVLRDILGHVAGMDFNRPPILWHWIYRRVCQHTGQSDPYRQIKRDSNALALELLPAWKKRVAAAAHPLAEAVKLAIAANIIDYGANRNLRTDDIPALLEQSIADPMVGDLPLLLEAIQGAASILYLADNAGELVFDRLLIELLPRGKVTVAVKGGPALNDALPEDAQATGVNELCPVIDTGTDGTGVILEHCSEAFRRQFMAADVVIAKGQANYETLDGCGRAVFFLLKVKCPVLGQNMGYPAGSLVVHHQPAPSIEAKPAVTANES
jgi:damage-control phosphatase, subfamily I